MVHKLYICKYINLHKTEVCILILVKWVQVTSIFKFVYSEQFFFFGSKFSFELVIVIWLNLLWKGAVINYVITIPPPLRISSHQISAFVLLAYPSKWCQRFIKSARLFFRYFNISCLKHYGYQNIGHSFSCFFYLSNSSLRLKLNHRILSNDFLPFARTLYKLVFPFFCSWVTNKINTLSIQLIRIRPFFSDHNHLIVKIVISKKLIKKITLL